MTVSFDFTNKKVLISGGSKGIGRKIAESFFLAGADVAIVARDSQELKDTKCTLRIPCNLSGPNITEEVFDSIERSFGALDILVNNVGGAIQFGNFFELEETDWQNAFDLNVMSMVRLSKAAVPFLRNSSTPRIINISSISGVEPGYYNPHYTTTKAATINFSKHLANLLASEGILVNCVCPGSIQSDAWRQCVSKISEKKRLNYEIVEHEFLTSEIKKIPLKRIGQVEDIAPLVLFLASEQASWITGSSFHIDGGKKKCMI